jgi:hypothetical protein
MEGNPVKSLPMPELEISWAKASDETILGRRRSRFETVAACTPAIILEAVPCGQWNTTTPDRKVGTLPCGR